jgi:hypothetical protein
VLVIYVYTAFEFEGVLKRHVDSIEQAFGVEVHSRENQDSQQ